MKLLVCDESGGRQCPLVDANFATMDDRCGNLILPWQLTCHCEVPDLILLLMGRKNKQLLIVLVFKLKTRMATSEMLSYFRIFPDHCHSYMKSSTQTLG